MTSGSAMIQDVGNEVFDVLERRLRQDLERLYDEKITLKKQRLQAVRRIDDQLKVVEEQQESIGRELERIRIEAIEERYRKELEQLKEKDVEIARLREDLTRAERTSAEATRKKREALQECNRLTIQLVTEKAKAGEAHELAEKLCRAVDEISELKSAESQNAERIRELEASLAHARYEADKSAEIERQRETVCQKFELYRTVTWLTQKRALDESRPVYYNICRRRKSTAIYEEVEDVSPCWNRQAEETIKEKDLNYANLLSSSGNHTGSSEPEANEGSTGNGSAGDADRRDSTDEQEQSRPVYYNICRHGKSKAIYEEVEDVSPCWNRQAEETKKEKDLNYANLLSSSGNHTGSSEPEANEGSTGNGSAGDADRRDSTDEQEQSRPVYYNICRHGKSKAIYEEVEDVSPCWNRQAEETIKEKDLNYANLLSSPGNRVESSEPAAADAGSTGNVSARDADRRDSTDEEENWDEEDYVNLSQQCNSIDSYRKSQLLLLDADAADVGSSFDDGKRRQSDAHHVSLLRELYEALTRKICSQSVAVRMFQCNALTLGELESIQSDRCRPTEATKTLLNFLLKQPVEVFDCFLEALKDSRQTDVYEWLVSDGQKACPPDLSHANLIQEQYNFLLESMDSMHSGLIEQLWSEGVIDHAECEDITAEQSSTRRNEKLLSVLSRKSAEQFQTFLEALDKTGQPHIIDQLLQSTYPRQRRSWIATSSSSSDLRRQTLCRKRSASLGETGSNLLSEPDDNSPSDYIYSHQSTSSAFCDSGISGPTGGDSVEMLYEQLNELEKALRESTAREVQLRRQLRLGGSTDRENRLQEQLDIIRELAPLALEHAFSEPRVIHAFPAAAPILGVALLQDELFVLRQRSGGEQLEVYDAATAATQPYALKRRVAVKGLNCCSSWNDMASCNRNFYVYVSDHTNGSVHCVERLGKSSQWQVRDKPCGLSVTPNDCNVLVTCRETARLRLFTARGKQLREICLQPDIVSPWHAVQLTCSSTPGHQYVLCHGWKDALHRVCIVDTAGRVVDAYSGARPDVGDPYSEELDGPRHLAVDRDGFVFVADSSTGGGVLLLSPSLQCVRKITARDGSSRFPFRLCLDVERRRLCVAQFSHGKLIAFQL